MTSSASNATPPTPPPLPGERHPGNLVAWLVIAISVFSFAWSANRPGPIVEEEILPDREAPALVSPAEATELAMLKVQSRIVIGLHAIDPRAASAELRNLRLLVSTTRGKFALATVYVFLEPEGQRDQVQRLLGTVESERAAELLGALETGVTGAQRDAWAREIGWFARLLPALEKREDVGGEIRKESAQLLLFLGGFVLLGGLAFLAGLILGGIFLYQTAGGRLRWQYEARAFPGKRHLFLESFAVYLGIMALGQWSGDRFHEGFAMAAYVVSFGLGLVWPVLRGLDWKTTRELLGWTSGRGVFREIGAGVLGYLGIVVIAFLGLMLTMLLVSLVNLLQGGGSDPQGANASHPIVGMLGASQGLLAKLILLFLAAGVAPFLEETMFRGALYRYFRNHLGFFLSSVIGGVIFAVIHPQGWLAVPALAGMGVGFALLREWRDSLIASMTAHAINNGVLILVLLTILG